MANYENILIEKAEQFSGSLNGSGLSETSSVRSKGIQQLKQDGFPKKKNEEYKFTHFSGILEKKFSDAEIKLDSTVSAEDVNKMFQFPENVHQIVVVNGLLRPDLSNLSSISEGLNICDFKSFASSHPGKLEKFIGQHADASKDAFTAWNSAYTNNGLVLEVGKNVVVDRPIFILYITDTRGEQNVVTFPRLLVMAASNSQVEFNSFYRTIGDNDGMINEVREVILNENAHVKMNRVQDDERAYSIGETKVYQPSNSTFTSNVITVSGSIIRNNLNIDVDGQGAEANMYGLYLTKGTTHVDNHTTVDHIQPNSVSNELYKGIMDGKSKGVFNGKIYVRSEAQKTNAFQSNNNILLSDQATINTKPQLEIWADDVKCSHGCTTGQMDEEAIFYLRTRGIQESDARALILKAFASDIVEKIDNEWLREYLDQIIIERLTIK